MSLLPLSESGKDAMEIAIQAAKAAGEILLQRFHGQKQVKYKGRGNAVTDVDLLAEQKIVSLLQQEYPKYGVISEESPSITGDSQYVWIVDPLDGTNNYTFGIPFFAVTLALTWKEETLLGLVYEPVRGELFWAVKGKGAFCNDQPVRASQKTTLKTCFIGCDMGYDDAAGRKILETASILWPGLHSLRIMGSAALGLAYVACGRFDLYFHRCLYPWDVAGGILLVREAGGEVTDWEGSLARVQSKQIIAANTALLDQFLEQVTPTPAGEKQGRS